MTAGEVRSEGSSSGLHTLIVDPGKAYPTLLLNELRARYTSQASAVVVGNAGLPLETAVAGANRLPSVIDGGAYSVLLLMEGVNELPNYQAALGAMGSMVQYASKRRGLRVYLATEPPENPAPVGCPDKLGGNWAFVAPYIDGLRAIAATQGVTLVDVYTAFDGDTTTLIDCDGLHPTPAGYQVIADTFFKAIRGTLEMPSTPTLTGLRIAPDRRPR
jgi:lysophospholipase L1-like esterase